jgi:hypothetical protein
MKKEIMLSLAISMALVSSASSVLAAQSTETNQATVSNGVSFTQGSPLEISGKVTKISEGEMTVSTQDGKSYKVPMWQFAKQTGFSDLGLTTGTEVTLKSTLPDLANIKVGTISAGIPMKMNATVIDSKNLIKATGSTLAIAAGSVTITPTNGSITTLTAVPGVKLDFGKIQPGTLKVDESTKGIIGTMAIPANGSFTLSSLTEGESIFIAGEISANGKKLKLSN